MPKTKISEFSATPANNTDIDSINIAEGCAPSGINDAIRELMAQLKDFQTGAVGDSFNGPVGTSTAAAGAFTTLSASGTTTLSGLTASTALALDASKNVVSVTNTGTGNNVLATSPTLVTPALGTPSALVGTNITGTATSFNINGTVGATTPTTGAFTTLAASGNVTLSGGTANGVAYLNGSKVVTSGSALTFDGTRLTTTSLTIADGANGNARFGSDSAYNITGGVDNGGFRFNLPSGVDYQFRINSSEQMRLTSTGLGIGTSSPAAKLHVSGTFGSQLRLQETGGTFFDIASGGRLDINNNAGTTIVSIAQSGNPVGTQLNLNTLGDLGLGYVPSTWYSTFSAFQFGGNGSSLFGRSENNMAAIGSNVYVNAAGSNTYINTNTASYYQQLNGQHQFYTAPSGTAGTGITFTQAMTLDNSGRLGIGATSLGTIRLNVRGDASATTAGIKISHPSNASSGFELGYLSSFASNDVSIWNYENGFIRFATNGSERARIDSSGNLGVGITDATQKIQTNGRIRVTSNGTNGGDMAVDQGGLAFSSLSTTPIVFERNNFGSESGRFDGSGNLLVGTTSYAANPNPGVAIQSGTAPSINIGHASGTPTNYAYGSFGYAGTQIGSISQNGTTAVAYNTSSDYRLKNTIAPMTGALAKVALLKPCTYKWNADSSDGEGFIAHELAEVCPHAVTGEKDAVDENGNPKYQGIDTSFLVATLTAAIQELKAEFDAYKASHP